MPIIAEEVEVAGLNVRDWLPCSLRGVVLSIASILIHSLLVIDQTRSFTSLTKQFVRFDSMKIIKIQSIRPFQPQLKTFKIVNVRIS